MPNPSRNQTHHPKDSLAQFVKHLPQIGGKGRQIQTQSAAPSEAEREFSEALASRMLELSVPKELPP